MINQDIKICYQKSIDLLKDNSSVYGFLASKKSARAMARNYLSVFSRDAVICSLGALASGDKELIGISKNSILTLGNFQAKNGQIPNFVKPESGQTSFWRLGCIDATLWWLIAIKFYDRQAQDTIKLEDKLADKIKLAINWLSCQEHQKYFLLMQNEASDWADIMPRSGFVLYSNVLWLEVKNLYHINTIEITKKFFEYLFNPASAINKKELLANPSLLNARRSAGGNGKGSYYLSYVNYNFNGKDVDVYGNLLALYFGFSSVKIGKNMVNYFMKHGISKFFPAQATQKPILENSRDWREYMRLHKQNYPYQYHNGGIWPYVGGFWVCVLKKTGKTTLAWQELEKLALANKANDWQFNEWFNGKTGKPMGMAGQSWNAGMFLLAFHSLRKIF
jgi:hypothetical protein